MISLEKQKSPLRRILFGVLLALQFSHAQWLAPHLESVYKREVTTSWPNRDTVTSWYHDAWLVQRGDTLEGMILPAKSCTLALAGIWDGEKYRTNIHCVGSKSFGVAKVVLSPSLHVLIIPAGTLCDSGNPSCKSLPDTLELKGEGSNCRGSALKWGALPRKVGGNQVVMEYTSSGFESRCMTQYEYIQCPDGAKETAYVRRADGQLRCAPLSLISPLKKRFFPPFPKGSAPALMENVWQNELEPFGFPVANSKKGVVFRRWDNYRGVVLPTGKAFYFSNAMSAVGNADCRISLLDSVARAIRISLLKDSSRQKRGSVGQILPRLRLVNNLPDYCRDIGEFKVLQLGVEYEWVREESSGFDTLPNVFLLERRRSDSGSGWQIFLGTEHLQNPYALRRRIDVLVDSVSHDRMRGVPNLDELFHSYEQWRWNRFHTCFYLNQDDNEHCRPFFAKYWENHSYNPSIDTLCLDSTFGFGKGCIVIDHLGKVSGAPRFQKMSGWRSCVGWDCPQVDTARLAEQGFEQLCEVFYDSPWKWERRFAAGDLPRSNYWTYKTINSSKKHWIGSVCFQGANSSGCLQMGNSGVVTGTKLFKKFKQECVDSGDDSEENVPVRKLDD